MQGKWVVNHVADAELVEMFFEGVALGGEDAVLVENGCVFGSDVGCGDVGKVLQGGVVAGGVLLACARPGFQMGNFGEQDGGLEGIEAEVSADDGVKVFGVGAVATNGAQTAGQAGFSGDDQAAVAGSAEVFAGEEAKAAGGAEAAGGFLVMGGVDALGGVFDYGDAGFLRDGDDLAHIGHLAEEVDG